MNRTLSKIMEAKDRGTVSVEVPEWGCTLVLVEPSVGKVLELQKSYLGDITDEAEISPADENLADFNWAVMSVVLHDQDMNPLFTDMEHARKVLQDKAATVVTQLIKQCGELIQPPQEELVEEARKNSETTPA